MSGYWTTTGSGEDLSGNVLVHEAASGLFNLENETSPHTPDSDSETAYWLSFSIIAFLCIAILFPAIAYTPSWYPVNGAITAPAEQVPLVQGTPVPMPAEPPMGLPINSALGKNSLPVAALPITMKGGAQKHTRARGVLGWLSAWRN